MTVDPTMIERIYEAAVLPELWPAVLRDISDQAASKGAAFMAQNVTRTS